MARKETWIPSSSGYKVNCSEGQLQLAVRETTSPSTDPLHHHEVDREAFMSSILAEYKESLSRKAEKQLGYPAITLSDYHEILSPFFGFHINNIGDPFISSNYAMHSRQFEVAVLDWFATLWELGDSEYWGYITTGGTEGNLHGLLLGREILACGILYTSGESHYSIFKAAKMLKMECQVINTLVSGEIDLADLHAKLLLNKDKPAIINVNIGTTFKGALDDLDLVIETLHKCSFTRERFYIHCDAALSGIVASFSKSAPKISFKKPIGSISVSGHKFLGCPMPCGVQITRKQHITILSKNIELIGTTDATISGSRNGHSPIFLWYILNKKGYTGIQNDVENCQKKAQYLANRLRRGGISTMLNEFSITVVFERPKDHNFVRKWQLACVGNMAHVIVLPKITIQMLDRFCDDLLKERLIWYKSIISTTPCVAEDIGDINCSCTNHKIRCRI
ncbi:hypothetical protein M9H77_25464 [Catharanthus roseus]|uniref:Uncharacterized protein n=1 Tax=Catharanthus roseus TaxID=4058 RepID=A0ACC0AB00_CATRO|nr:hypothetical protein M9H77_25464 [Catharanthus roseus]